MDTKKFLSLAFSLTFASFLLGGCGGDAYQLSKEELAAFKAAPPEVKQAWEKGLAADKANDYLTASTNYRRLLTQPITSEQLVAVQTALGGLNYRINEAAANGDVSARKVLDDLKESGTRR
jgi:hypothetical protein